MLAPSTVQSKPAPVRTAIVLLWATLAVGVFTIAISLITIASRLPSLPRFLGPILVLTVLWVLGIVFTARRSNLGRFLVFVLVAYAAFNLVYRFRLLVISANPGALISLIELAVRLYAVYLLLRPESNAWFADKEQGIIG
jgi:hypothetical protein